MTGNALIARAAARLREAGVAEPARDARRLLAYAWGTQADRLVLILPEDVPPGVADRFDNLIDQRARRVPVSHLTGERAFYGHVFEVGPDVLDPRPETEMLVAAALEVPFGRVLDLGTGSGAILTSLMAARGAGAYGVGTDLSPAALAVAGRNAARLDVADRCVFHAGSWFGALPRGTVAFDLIVSNPPYIAADEMPGLAPEVRDFEPRMALTDEADGLSCYRQIVAEAPGHLIAGGWLMVEIGPTQGQRVAGLFADAGFADVTVRPDLDGRNRIVCGQLLQK